MVLSTLKPVYGSVRDRKARRQQEAMIRNETYSKLTLDEKLKEQYKYGGKQYLKLAAKTVLKLAN